MFTSKPLINKSFMVQDFFNYNEIRFKFEQVKILMSTIYIQKKHNCFIVVAITVNISIILLCMYTFYFFLYVFALHVGEKRKRTKLGELIRNIKNNKQKKNKKPKKIWKEPT